MPHLPRLRHLRSKAATPAADGAERGRDLDQRRRRDERADPSTGSLLSIGACVVGAPERAFLVEIRPIPGRPWSESAQKVHGLSRRHLDEHGREPADAIRAFIEWVEKEAAGRRAVFVGFNAPFDWMWIADHAWAHAGRNPFGSSALDLKALYLGLHLGEIQASAKPTSPTSPRLRNGPPAYPQRPRRRARAGGGLPAPPRRPKGDAAGRLTARRERGELPFVRRVDHHPVGPRAGRDVD